MEDWLASGQQIDGVAANNDEIGVGGLAGHQGGQKKWAAPMPAIVTGLQDSTACRVSEDGPTEDCRRQCRAQVATIRLRLLKIGAVITRNTRRIRLYLSSSFPFQSSFVPAWFAF